MERDTAFIRNFFKIYIALVLQNVITLSVNLAAGAVGRNFQNCSKRCDGGVKLYYLPKTYFQEGRERV